MRAELIPVDEAARRLGGISPWTVRKWLSQGRLKRVKVGRRTMVAESELTRFVDESCETLDPQREFRRLSDDLARLAQNLKRISSRGPGRSRPGAGAETD